MKLSSIFKENRILNSKKSVNSQKITQLPSSGCYFNEQRLKCLTKIPKILFSHNNYTKKDQGIKLKAEKSFLNHVVSQRTHFLCCLLDVELLLMKRAVNNNFLRNSHWMNVWKGENGRKKSGKNHFRGDEFHSHADPLDNMNKCGPLCEDFLASFAWCGKLWDKMSD